LVIGQPNPFETPFLQYPSADLVILLEQLFNDLSNYSHSTALNAHLPDLHLYVFPVAGHPGNTGQLIYLVLHEPS